MLPDALAEKLTQARDPCSKITCEEIEEFLDTHTAQMRADSDAVADAAEAGTRSSGEVADAPEIAARFKLGPSAVARDSGAYTLKLSSLGDGRPVVFRDGLFYVRDAETVELVRAHARKKSIRGVHEYSAEIDTFGDTFAPRFGVSTSARPLVYLTPGYGSCRPTWGRAGRCAGRG